MLTAKIHRVHVTEANLNYVGSITSSAIEVGIEALKLLIEADRAAK